MKAPYQFTVTMSGDRYRSLHDMLAHQNTNMTSNDVFVGKLQDKDVNMQWVYQPVLQSLVVTITACNSLRARLAPASVIQTRIESMLLLAPSTGGTL